MIRLLLPLLAFILGCGSAGPVEVKGKVIFDGSPLAEGEILFFSADPKHGPEASSIRDGAFACKAHPGTNQVKITASKLSTKTTGSFGKTARVNYIPAIYNEKTTLSAQVEAKGPNEFTFDMKPSETP